MNSEELGSSLKPIDLRQNVRGLRFFFWGVAAIAGFLEVWAARFYITPDGNYYLEIAEAYLRGDWKNAVNAYWSPLFSWLLALCFGIFHFNPFWDSTLLHLLNYAAFLVSLLCFEFFFKAFLRARTQSGWARSDEEPLEVAWWALGYGLFLSTSLFVLTISIVTPDIWVSAITYLVAGLVLRIYSNGGGWRLFAILGFLLACGYLTKTFYFPMGLVFLSTAWRAAAQDRQGALKALKQAALGLAVFSLIAGPWIALLSRAKNRLTYGDVGKIALVFRIGQPPQAFIWHGGNGTGIPRHPVQQLHVSPQLFEFGAPVSGSYPPGYDPSYWMEGAKLHFSLKGFLLVLRQSAGTLFQFAADQAEFAAGLLFLYFLMRRQPGWVASFQKQWVLWLPSLIACLSYTVVLVEGRYVAPFIVLLWLAGFSCSFSLTAQLRRNIALPLILGILSVCGLRIVKHSISNVLTILNHPQNTEFEIAEGLHKLGIQRGDKVAGLSLAFQVHWAHLAGVKIVAEIPLGNEVLFWTTPPDSQRKLLELVAATGAKAIVTRDCPSCAINAGWTPLGRTGYYALLLPSLPTASAAP